MKGGPMKLSAERAQGSGWGSWISVVTAMVVVLVLGVSWAARAEDEPATEEFRDRLMIRGGWAYVFGVNADVTLRGDRTGIGASVDFAKTLGGETARMRSESTPSTVSTSGMPLDFRGIGSGWAGETRFSTSKYKSATTPSMPTQPSTRA